MSKKKINILIVIIIMAFIMPINKVKALSIEGDIDYDSSNNILNEINNYREDLGLDSLFYDMDLSMYAVERSEEISVLYDNTRLDGSSPYDGFNYPCSIFIERIYNNSFNISTVSDIIGDSTIKSIGIGTYVVNDNIYYVIIFSDYMGSPMNMNGINHISKNINIDSSYIDYNIDKNDFYMNEIIDYNNIVLYSDVLNISNLKLDSNDINWDSTNDMVSIDDNNSVSFNKDGNLLLGMSLLGINKDFNINIKKLVLDDLNIDLSIDSIQLNVDSSYLVDVDYNYDYDYIDKTIIWSSNNDKVASVSDNGLIKGNSVGDVVLKACSVNNSCKDIDVMVRKYIDDVFFEDKSIDIEMDNYYYIGFNSNNEIDYRKYINYEVLDKNIASVSSTGVLKGISNGNTIVYIGYYNKNGEYIKKSINVMINKSSDDIIITNNMGNNNYNIDNNYLNKEVINDNINTSTFEILEVKEKDIGDDNKDIKVYDDVEVIDDKDNKDIGDNKSSSDNKDSNNKDKDIDKVVDKIVKDLWKKSALGYAIITVIILLGLSVIKRLIKMMKIKL